MSFLKQGLGLALLTAGLTAVPTIHTATAAPAAAPGDSVVQRIRAEAQGKVRVSTERATDRVGFVRARGGDLLPSERATSTSTAAAKATAYLDEYAAAFGALPSQLERTDARANGHGWTVEFAQAYRGVPVFGGTLIAHLDRAGDLTSVNGYAAPGLALDVTPTLSASAAASKAVDLVRTTAGKGADGTPDAAGLKAVQNELMIYRMGSTRGESGAAVLAYVVEVSNASTVRETVFVDAHTGKVVNRYSMIHDALERHVLEAGGKTDPAQFQEVWKEGDPFPGTLDQPQQDLVEGTGEAYWLFENTFGFDSWDGKGGAMRTVNNDGRIACPNANWNGTTTNYCDGVTSDDTVAHEWAHAYTETTNGLVYQWQSGAMNEAYSDIWGETVDMLNDRYNETPDTPRTAGQCSEYTRGDISVVINSPAAVAGACQAAPAAFGPVFTGPVTTDVVVALDAANADSTNTDGCSAYTNAGAVSGKFAYVDRGGCTFADKADIAEAAGATGIVIGNNDSAAPAPFSPSGSAGIYGLMVSTADAAKFKQAGTANITVDSADTDPKDDSYRWLSGEGDPAFGGAIRDMWNPTCYGDPGKVSDAEYWCSYEDSGGVHTNSGVVNHLYALLVDGGVYNGVTVPSVGLDQAAHLFWRAQSEYLTETSDFADLADGLEASCTDLTGQDINEVTLTPNATPALADDITAGDCTALASGIAAVELRKEPTQCDFGPLLKPGAPSACGKGYRTKAHFSENFEDGLKGWKKSEQVVYKGAKGIDWRTTAQAPGKHASKVAMAPDPTDAGECSSTSTDISSRNSITSPQVTVPAGKNLTLSFRHYVAVEYAYDGGNVKLKVGKGKFKEIKAAAYDFNAPGAQLATDGTSPLAGQMGWTGTDGNEPSGSWGTTVVDLKKAGAKPGQKIRFRFDMGRDGCGGIDGWYVDDIKVTTCVAKTKTVARPGQGTRVRVAVKRVGTKGSAPSGVVKLLKGTKVVGKATVRKGVAVVRVTGLRPGRHQLTARYVGTTAFGGSSDKVRVRIRR